MTDLAALLTDAFRSGGLHALTIFHRSEGHVASARWNGSAGWTEATEIEDPVKAITRALTEKLKEHEFLLLSLLQLDPDAVDLIIHVPPREEALV